MSINKAVAEVLTHTSEVLLSQPTVAFRWYLGNLPNALSAKLEQCCVLGAPSARGVQLCC